MTHIRPPCGQQPRSTINSCSDNVSFHVSSSQLPPRSQYIHQGTISFENYAVINDIESPSSEQMDRISHRKCTFSYILSIFSVHR
jgi:hypothetical protein